MSQVNTSMNFLPEDYVEKRQAARAAVVFIGLLLVVVGGIVGTWYYAKGRNQATFDERDQVNARFEEMSKKIAQAQELKRQRERMIAKADIVTTLMERVKRSVLLGELARSRPVGVTWVSFELKTRELQAAAQPNPELERARRERDGLPPEAVRPPAQDVVFTLIGSAPTDSEVAAYMTALQKSPLLSSVTLLFVEESKKSEQDTAPVRKFNIELHVNPEADLRGKATLVDALRH